MVSALNISPLATVPLHFSAFQNPIAVFFPSVDPIIHHGRRGQLRQALGGGDPGGEHANEPASPTHEVRLTSSAYSNDLHPSAHSGELFYFVSRLVVNDSLRPLPRAGKPSDDVSSTPASSSDSSDSYNNDDARCFL